MLNFLTMSSREIAELTGKEHDNVRRDIKNLADALSLSFEEKAEPSEGGRPSKVFMLAKRETLILISGYSIELRARIIDRWQELEAQQGPKLPTTMAEALRLGQSAQRGLRRTLQPLVQMWSASGAHSTQANSPRAPTIARHSSTVVRELPGIKIDRPPQR